MDEVDWVEATEGELLAAADRERALREEVERLTDDNAYLNDLITSYEIGTVQKAWSDHAEQQDAQIERLSDQVERWRSAYLFLRESVEEHDVLVGDEFIEEALQESLHCLSVDEREGVLDPEPHGAASEGEG